MNRDLIVNELDRLFPDARCELEYTKDYDIDGQVEAFNHCYKTNRNNYDWFIRCYYSVNR